MPTIYFNHLTKKFSRNNTVIKDLNLEIPQGEFLTVIGPSGCGKSTLLRLIAGLEKPSSGEILFDGIPVTQIAPVKRNISMVFQDYALYGHMTVRKNMTFGLKERGLSKQEIQMRVQEAAELLDLTPLLDRKPSSLSGGQKQRVAIARAFVRKPAILLLDEPFSNLDNCLSLQLQRELLTLHKKLGATFVYVTHNKAAAFSMDTKIAVMKEGEILQTGTVSQMRHHPANTFIAEEVSESKLNFIHTDSVIVSIPPEAFHLTPQDSDNRSLSAVILHTDRLGNTTELLCRLEDGQEMRCVLAGDHDVTSGQKYSLYFSQRQIHLYDPVSKICIDS